MSTLAAVSAALLATAAVAAEPVVYYKITLQDGRISIAPAPASAGRSDGRLQQLELSSFQWGTAQAASYGGHSNLGASDKVTTQDVPPPRDSSLGSASERSFVVPHVLERGTLTVKGSFPGCTVGKRYGGMQFAGGSMRYELKDVVISNCSIPTLDGSSKEGAPTESVTFVYGRVKYFSSSPTDAKKVQVRGWDPEKKEQ